MSVTLELDLPEDIASEAAKSGLLQSASISALLAEEIRRRKSAAGLKDILSIVRSIPGEAPSAGAIRSEIVRVRTSSRSGECRS